MQRRRHIVLIPQPDGEIKEYSLKGWLRQHPDFLPGVDYTIATSHQLRAALREQGWKLEFADSEVRLLPPSRVGDDQEADDVSDLDPESDDEIVPAPTFSLEKQLRDFLASNLHTISVEGRRLRLYGDASEREGIEFRTDVGPIDILAIDDEGSFFVFELKRADSSDRVVGQLARYMGWVQQTIGKDRKVYGVIVARSVNRNLRYAASIMPNVRLFEYAVQFTLTAAHDLGTG